MAEFLFYLTVLIAALTRYHWRSHTKAFHQADPWIFEQYDQVIGMHIPYYAALSPAGKQHFVARAYQVQGEIRIEGREEFEVTEEVRILVCACIAQLTFGFDKPGLPIVKGVLIYPGVFYSRLARNWVKGLAMNNGVVFLSWPDFLKGYENSTSTYNLGLHEFTHMMKMQTDDVFTSDKRLNEHFETWEEIGQPVFTQIRNSGEHFFREYAGTNKSEFLSVCVENFFEVPAAFEKTLPTLYYHLCFLLNQDPQNAAGDYELTEDCIRQINEKIIDDLPVYHTLISSREYRFWLIASQFTWGILFFDLFILVEVSTQTQLAVLRMSLFTMGIFILSRWFHYKSWKSTLHVSYLHYLLLRLIPLLLLLMFILAAVE